MKVGRTVLINFLCITLLYGPALAGDFGGLWLGTVTVNKVSEVNLRARDMAFDLGVAAARGVETIIPRGSAWSYKDSGVDQGPSWSTGWRAIAAGKYHTAAITNDGELWAWGNNDRGQLGAGNNIPETIPTRVGTGVNWKTVSAGYFHTAAITNDGRLYTWGLNSSGQLGDGTTTYYRNSPVQVGSLVNWAAVSAGNGYTVGIDVEGKIWTWGDNTYGQLGTTGGVQKTPLNVSAGGFKAVSAGANHALALTADGRVFGFGRNEHGQIGNNSATDTSYNSSQILELYTHNYGWRWKAISAGDGHSAAIRSDGTLWYWGWTGGMTPKQVGTDSDWVSVSLGLRHGFAVKADGSRWAWGYNGLGEFGDGNPRSGKISLTRIGNDAGWSVIASGYNHAIAIKGDGTLKVWGTNYYGQLGDGTKTNRPSPVSIDIGGTARFSGWSTGPAPLGYKLDPSSSTYTAPTGSTQGTTVSFGANADNKNITTYFQKNFTVTDPTRYSALRLKAWRDDGIVIYLNGVEIKRNNLPAGALSYATLASAEIADNPEALNLEDGAIPVTNLKSGINSLAVELHGVNGTNPDLYFDLELTGILKTAPTSDIISDNSPGWQYKDTGGAPEDPWRLATYVTDASWKSGFAPLGFGKKFDQTPVANSASVYLRKSVTVTNPGGISRLELRLLRDDGAIVYLNGKELARSNMPGGAVSHETSPLSVIGAEESEKMYQIFSFEPQPGDLVDGENVFAVEVHQHPSELPSAVEAGEATPTQAEFPLRVLLHVDSSGAVRLLKEGLLVTQGTGTNVLVLADSAKAGQYNGVVKRGDTMVGIRTSAIGYDFAGPSVECVGAVEAVGETRCGFSLPFDHPNNPFLHRFHPDHDNLDARFQSIQKEAYDISRVMKLTFSDRYPANPDETERPLSKPPEWGSAMLGGTFTETLTGLHKQPLGVSGWFTLRRVSSSKELRQ